MGNMSRRRILIAGVCFISALLLFLVVFRSLGRLPGRVLVACLAYLVSLAFVAATLKPSSRLVDLVVWPRTKERLLPSVGASLTPHLLWLAAGWFLLALETTVEVLNLKRVFSSDTFWPEMVLHVGVLFCMVMALVSAFRREPEA